MKVGLVFSRTDSRPLYQQIMEQVTQRVAVGDWPPGTPLPSVRELAIDAKVSVITVKRAYLELARDGVIVTQHGKGSWVNDAFDLEGMQRQELLQNLEQAGRLAKSLSLSADQVVHLLKPYLE